MIPGIGAGNGTLQKGIELASRTTVAQNWRRCKFLIIDEISMIDGDYFEVQNVGNMMPNKNDVL